ncbi:hypothetical protein ACQ5SO_05620 [Rhodovulum sp. DZ06]|uniref:hypothetical protein n=1 Tax=Rhodovulum sp. DZ06 TaxID=3425126 RepID=UPI003D33E347
MMHPDMIDPDLVPTEFPPNRFKLWLGALAQYGIGLFVLWKWVEGGAGDAVVPVACMILFLIGGVMIREALDPRPLLRVTPEGLEDRRHGLIRWEDVEYWQIKNAMLSKYFGYSVKKGVKPARGVAILRVQGLMNALSGRPQRIWLKHMMPLGLEPMALACRQVAPEKERP